MIMYLPDDMEWLSGAKYTFQDMVEEHGVAAIDKGKPAFSDTRLSL